MANYPTKAVKKFTKPAHREIAAGILIAYGLFPRTQDGYDQAQKLIAGRETWLAPSNLPNYYDDIESDLMTGRETAGIINIRMVLKEFYGLDNKPVSTKKLNTGTTSVYKPEDKFVDDKMEELDKKLEETSDQIMDAVDALIEQQKQAFEEFKRQEAEKVKQRIAGREQYPEPIGPKEKSKEFGYNQYETAIGPLPMQGPKEPPKKKSSPQIDDPWESEVPDQLGTKLDELIDQVKKDPLPQASTKRRKTKGKTPTKRRKLADAKELGLGGTLSEIMENVVQTKEALFELYKVESKRFELRKKTDNQLTQLLKSKRRESELEGGLQKPEDSKKKGKGENDEDEDEKKEKGLFGQALSQGLVAGITALLLPAALGIARPFFGGEDKEEEKVQDDQEKIDNAEQKDAEKELQQEDQQDPAQPPVQETPPSEEEPPVQEAPPSQEEPPTPTPTPAPLRDTSIPGDPGYQKPEPFPLRTAATGGKFKKGKKEKLKPLSSKDTAKEQPKIKKLTKPLMDAITLPQKVVALGSLSLAKTILGPFASVLPQDARSGVESIFDNVARSAGLTGFDFSLSSEKGIFQQIMDSVKKLFEPLFNIFKGKGNGGNAGGGSGGGGGGGGGGGNTGPDNTPNNFKGSTGQEQAMNFFMGKGLSAEQSAGIVGNLMQESTAQIDPKAVNSTGHRGIAQWDANRWAGFEKFAAKNKLDVNSREAQLQWVWEEMRTGSGGLGVNRFKSSAKTADQAAALFLTDFERSGEKPGDYGYDVRLKNARILAEKFKPKPPTTPPPPTPRPRPQSRSSQISQRLQERREAEKKQNPTVPVGTASDKQSGG